MADTNSLIITVVTIFTMLLTTFFFSVNLIIIHRLKSNLLEHLLLLKYLNYCGLIFRLMFPWGFVFHLTDTESIILAICRIPFSMGEGVFSTVLCATCYYTVMYRKRLHAAKYLMSIFLFIIILSILVIAAVLIPFLLDSHAIPDQVDIVGNIRTLFVIINFIIVFLIFNKVYSIVSKGSTMTEIDKVLRTLSHRIVFYPIIQSVTRSGNIWYYFQSEYNSTNPDEADNMVFASILYLCFCAVFFSFGFLVTLLIMQPTAYDHFQALFPCFPAVKEPIVKVTEANLRASTQFTAFEAGDARMTQASVNYNANPRSSTNRKSTATVRLMSMMSSAHTRNTSTSIVEDFDFLLLAEAIEDIRTDEELYQLLDTNSGYGTQVTMGSTGQSTSSRQSAAGQLLSLNAVENPIRDTQDMIPSRPSNSSSLMERGSFLEMTSSSIASSSMASNSITSNSITSK